MERYVLHFLIRTGELTISSVLNSVALSGLEMARGCRRPLWLAPG
jgi:hypothetical protein